MKGATVKHVLWFMSTRLIFAAVAAAQDRAVPTADKRPAKPWNRTGPLGETPEHVTDAYPLSNQQNKGDWVKFDPMSDEFDGEELDLNKWNRGLYWWKGRQPALFSDRNVTVSDGKLHLTMRREKVPEQFEKLGYKDYTSAALHTKARSSYGYYEVKAKPMSSGGSSSFWFQVEDTPGWLTEIDVFEIGGKAKGFEHKYNMNVHVFRTPTTKEHWSVGGVWVAPWRLADDYHVYGLEWTPEEIRYYVDGVVVRTVENTHWHQPLFLIFDSETMPKWFGMPDDDDLPSTFSVEYVRAWKKASVLKNDPVAAIRSALPMGWAILKVDEDACPALRPNGKGKAVYLHSPQQHLVGGKVRTTSVVYIMPADYDDGGADPTHGQAQAYPAALILTTPAAKVYLWGNETPFSAIGWSMLKDDILKAIVE